MSNKLKINSFIVGFSILAVITSLLIVRTGFAQDGPDDIERFANELRESGGKLKERYNSQLERVELKQGFVEILQERHEMELNEKESEDKEKRLSLISYELFIVRTRLYGEQLKLWQIENMIELQSFLGTDDEAEAIKSYFDELVTRREEAVKDMLELSAKPGEYITDPNIKNQFEIFLEDSLNGSSK